jgi:hypothetical protein
MLDNNAQLLGEALYREITPPLMMPPRASDYYGGFSSSNNPSSSTTCGGGLLEQQQQQQQQLWEQRPSSPTAPTAKNEEGSQQRDEWEHPSISATKNNNGGAEGQLTSSGRAPGGGVSRSSLTNMGEIIAEESEWSSSLSNSSADNIGGGGPASAIAGVVAGVAGLWDPHSTCWGNNVSWKPLTTNPQQQQQQQQQEDETVEDDPSVRSSFSSVEDDQQQHQQQQQRPMGALERLMSDDYVPTERWTRHAAEDDAILQTLFEQLCHLHGCATLNKLRSCLRQRHLLPRSVKSVPLRALVTAHAELFYLDGSHVYLRDTRICQDLASL